MSGKVEEQKFQIFRGDDAPDIRTVGCMAIDPFTPLQAEGMKALVKAGFRDGEKVRVLVDIPGFSLTHVWFKPSFPLPLHSHDADCLYCVIAGSLQLGMETLGPQDCFFVPADVAYTYTPGPKGVEVLEFRQANRFDFKLLAMSSAYYERAAATIAKHRESWLDAKMPALND